MPLYEYECDNCGNHVEKIQSVHDEPLRQCPNCSSDRMRKVFHPAGIIFKGSGWYITDSRKSSSASISESSASSESKTETKAETKSTPTTESTKPSSETK